MRRKHLCVFFAALAILIGNGSYATAQSTGSLVNLSASAQNDGAGAESIYTFTFTTSNNGNGIDIGIPANGKIFFEFEADFDLSQVSIAYVVSGMNGGFASIVDTSGTGLELFITRDGTGTAVSRNATVSIRIANVVNATTVGGSYRIYVKTMTNANTHIDQGTVSGFDINAGPMDYIRIEDLPDGIGAEFGSATLSSGQTRNMYAVGYDAYGNYAGNMNVDWSVAGGIGTVSPAVNSSITLFTATITGTGNVVADDGSRNVDNTGEITVNPGTLSYVKIVEGVAGDGSELTTKSLTTDQSLLVHAAGYDLYDNYINDVAVDWSVNDSLGSIAPATGPQAVFEPDKTGTGQILADHATATDDQTGDITVNAGALKRIRIVDGASGDGIELGTKNLSTGDTLTVHAAGYDADGNYREDPQVSWTVVNDIGTVTPAANSEITNFVATRIGSGFIKATHPDAGSDLTDEITVGSGQLHRILIQNKPGGMGTTVQDTVVYLNQTTRFYAAGYDEYGNYIRDIDATWKHIGNFSFPDSLVADEISIAPQQLGLSGRFTADSAGLVPDTTGLIQVADISYIRISESAEGGGQKYAGTVLSADDSVTLFAAAYDVSDNFIDTVTVNWVVENMEPSEGVAGSRFTFSPTVAHLSGRIIADHAYARDDSTGLITIVPGVPFGHFQMNVDSTELSANGSDQTGIMSDTIYDYDGNVIQQNSQFTVVAKPSNLGLMVTPADVNSTIAGHQINSDAQGRISFTVRAGTLGGTAYISVNSVTGSAHGDTTISLSGIRLISVTAEKERVTRNQNDVQVQMLVRNTSPEPVDSLEADLKFKTSTGEDRRSDYEVFTGTLPILNGGEQRIIDLSVNVKSNALLDSIFIDGIIRGATQSKTVVQDTSAAQKDSWIVQDRPILRILGVTAPELVEQGTVTTVRLRVKNEGEAEASITKDSLMFFTADPLIDVTDEYSQIPEHSYPYVLGSDEIRDLRYTVTVGANATRGDVILDGFISGVDANSGVAVFDDDADTTDTWEVKRIGEIDITDFEAQQDYVISGQMTPWTIRMKVENKFETVNMTLDSAALQFYTGTQDITSEFEVENPTKFQEYGSTEILYADTTETLVFSVRSTTNQRIGNIRITGSVYLSDIAQSQLTDFSETQIIVKTPSTLQFGEISVSQTEVTQAQNNDWMFTAAVTNIGQSNIIADLSSDSTYLVFSGSDDFKVIKPSKFILSQSNVISSGMTDTLRFIVDSTGTVPGRSDIKIQVLYADTYAAQDSFYAIDAEAYVDVQTPASLKILDMVNIGPNSPFVNTGQDFQLRVDLANEGGDGAHDIQLIVNTDGQSTVVPVENISIDGESVDSIFVDVHAAGDWSYGEVFSAAISGAVGDNTNEFDAEIIKAADDDSALAILQRPAELSITKVIPEFGTVEALSRDWKISVAVRRDGAESVRIKEPSANDLRFLINSEEQDDYIIIPPEGFKNSGDLVLSGWDVAEDTLVYTVDKTGLLGGDALIEANLEATYLNNDSIVFVQESDSVSVETTANLSILQTTPVCPRLEDGVGIISTEQNYSIRVTLQNSGEEAVDNVWVSLLGRETYSQMLDSISAKDQASLSFFLKAPDIEKRIDYVAVIDSGISRLSGQPALIGSSYDSEASVEIQNKARLSVQVNPEDSVMTVGVLSSMRFKVENLGTAKTDSLGKVIITIPENYKVMNGTMLDSVTTTIDFVTGREETLRVVPPGVTSFGDQFRITMSTTPKDMNTNLPAFVENHTGTITVSTVASDFDLYTRITWPNGAKDNTVSTEQLFDVRVDFDVSPNIKRIEAGLDLADGYQFSSGVESIQVAENDAVVWRVKAPVEENLLPVNMMVTAVGYTGTVQYELRDTIGVVSQKKAQLTLGSLGIVSPSQTDSVLSLNQDFTISTTVVNDGSAPVVGTGTLRIDFGATGVTTLENLSKTFITGTPVLWHATAPGNVTSRDDISISIESVPFDGNTTDFASGIGNKRSFNVRTIEGGFVEIDSIKIVDPIGATDRVLSTNQIFTVRAYLHWNNCDALPTMSIKLPPGFLSDIESQNPAGAANQGIVSWEISAPSGVAANQMIWTEARANDINSGALIIDSSDNISVSVVRQAEIWLNAEIIEPDDALDGVVSTGQHFTIKANILKSGDASLEDFYTARLTMPAGLGYVTTDALDQRKLYDQTVYWEITAPSAAKDADIFVIKLVEPPNDENTNQGIQGEALIEDTRAIPITTEEKSVTISVLPKKANNSVAKGDSSIPMLSLEILISGDEESSHVLFSGMKIKLKDKYGTVIVNPTHAISRISIKNATFSETISLGEIEKIPETEAIDIAFTNKDTLIPGISNKIEFMVDIAPDASLTDFRLSIDSLSYFDMMDIGSGQRPRLQLTDGESIASGFSVIVPQDFERAFWNYPNPFGSDGRELTTIQYFLDQDSDIEIRIYTLLGELVWSRQYSADEPQGKRGLHDGATAITWNGRNEGGNTVLNGVYIAYLNTSYGKTVTTKIAVLK
ncbi:MAG: hypothetical protein V2J62_09210 [candidate division KSB1 bacterium]|jgi:hypothetical protein|nr:hypothetical protein [candidate division KSB1 bacterium]